MFSCGKEKIIQLPDINHSDISMINDVSSAYLFYDEKMPDSIELNRKNLIITTNWLVNVDKRLTLKQALPKIMFLQNKKRNSEMHKNEDARNYYTCNNTNIKNLSFIDFTDIIYHEENSNPYLTMHETNTNQLINIKFYTQDSTLISFISNGSSLTHTSNQKEFLEHLEANLLNQGNVIIVSEFNASLSFQDYITYKSLLSQIDFDHVKIADDEFIFN
jgi:hypothetical protein